MREKTSIILLFLLFFRIGSANAKPFVNDSLPEPTHKNIVHKWAIGVVISPASNYRKLTNLIPPPYYSPYGNPNFSDSINEVELPKTVMNLGITFSILLTKNLTFQTGLNYLDMGYKSNGYLYNDDSITRTWAVHHDTKIEKATFRFYELPLILYYHLRSKNSRWEVGVFVGVSMAINANDFFYKSRQDLSSKPTSPGIFPNIPMYHGKFSTMRFATNIGISLNYKLNERICLGLSPFYKYYFSTFYSQSFGNYYAFMNRNNVPMSALPVKEFPYCYGVNLSASYLF